MRVILTGSGGFLGSNVLSELLSVGAKVVTVRKDEYDLRQFRCARRLLNENPCDVVIHLAGIVGGIGANSQAPADFFHANMAMGLNIIEACRLRGVRKFVTVGTVCSYPADCPTPFKETDLWNGYPEPTNAPYGIAKRALLTMCQAYRKQYGMNAIYLIPVNLYGPGDHDDAEKSHVIPALVKKFVTAKRRRATSVVLWGTGTPSREFLYVKDAAQGIITAMMKYDGAEPVNLGTGIEITIAALADRIKALVGYEGEIVFDKSKPDGQRRRCLDTSRARESFGWSAMTPLDEGLKRTVEAAMADKPKLEAYEI